MSTPKKKDLKLSDQVIGHIRELLQLSLLTNTSLVDHLRAVKVEESTSTEGSLILGESYVEGWNKMAEAFYAQAQAKAEQMGATLAGDEEGSEPEEEIVISRDPETGKLVGNRQKLVN